MKSIRFLISLVVTISFVMTLNVKISSVPPLGKFLDPVNGFWANAESDISMPEKFAIQGISDPVSI